MVDVDAGVVPVALLVLVLNPLPAADDPPVVEVPAEAGVVVPAPVCPPPLVVLTPALALEVELPPALEPVPEVVLVPAEIVDVELLAVPAAAFVDGLAALVVGTVSGGAPVVSLLPVALPPQAASTTAVSTQAVVAIRAR